MAKAGKPTLRKRVYHHHRTGPGGLDCSCCSPKKDKAFGRITRAREKRETRKMIQED